ncbi:MAG: hypothetical protein J1E16_00855 [Muribaculaceae bacterium]|nr:hypothetical protein [Muribaculaceae bacterium]
MRRRLIVETGLLLSFLAMNAEGVEPKYETGVYVLKMSPNGKWMGSRAGDASVYNFETGENIYHSPCFLGLGNAVANNGMAVGEANDIGALFYKGKTYFPESIGGDKYWFCDLNAITPDGKYIAGILNNTKRDGVSYVPFIATVNESGEVGDPFILPYPKMDFFGAAPQFVTAVWISDDAKTVVGQVQDWRGMFSYPIYFKQDEKGEWTYGLPTESQFNPTGIDIPVNPWLSEPPYPEPADFMNGARKDAYLADFEAYSTGMGAYPYPQDYMLEEEFAKYAEAVEEYNNWYYGHEQDIKDYIAIYQEVLKTTQSFGSNDMALHPSGDYFFMRGGVEDENGDMVSGIYKFSTIDDSIETIKCPQGGFFPHQVLSDGTLLITKGIENVPTTYILLPDSEEFITLQEYFAESYPEISEWLDKKVPGGTGVVLMSEDKKIITGALVPDQLADFDYDNSPFFYSTYFINLNDTGSVESLVSDPENGVYTVYGLNGIKVMETKDATELNKLDKGIYIVNGNKIIKK